VERCTQPKVFAIAEHWVPLPLAGAPDIIIFFIVWVWVIWVVLKPFEEAEELGGELGEDCPPPLCVIPLEVAQAVRRSCLLAEEEADRVIVKVDREDGLVIPPNERVVPTHIPRKYISVRIVWLVKETKL